MKRIVPLFLTLLLLIGCTREDQLDAALTLRQRLLQSAGCTFDATITADYGEQLYTFGLHCQCDQDGVLTFSVTSPDTICGITGSISKDGGNLTFDAQVLAFEWMAEGRITPVAAPWVLINTLRSGYIQSCTDTDDGMRLMIHDSYEEDALQLDIRTDQDHTLCSAEFYWQGNRILTISVDNFTYL